MEADSCVKSVVASAVQYRNNPTDANLVHLQRQLDVLISISNKGSCLEFFDPCQMLPTECLTCMVELLNDPQVQPTLANKIMITISNLANNNSLRERLHTSFNATAALVNYLRSQIGSDSDNQLCVRLLGKISYQRKVPFDEVHMEDLLKFLIKNVQNTAQTDMKKYSLMLLANLCRNNFAVQSYIKNMDNVKSLYKTLLDTLSNSDRELVVFALSILTSLCLKEYIGERLFNMQNINQTFALMFNILHNDHSGSAMKYVVDIFTDLMKHVKIQQSLTIYDPLKECIQQVFEMIGTSNSESICKVFEVLLSFCSVNSLRCVVCRTLLESPALQDPAQYKQIVSTAQITEPFFAVLHWASKPVTTHGDAPLLAFDFLREMYQEMLDLGLTVTISPQTDHVLPMTMDILLQSLDTKSRHIKAQTLRVVKALQLLNTLCIDEALRVSVGKGIDSKTCLKLVQFQYTNNNINTIDTFKNCEWSSEGVDVVLYTLSLMLNTVSMVVDMERCLCEAIQDSRVVPFLTQGLISDSREKVQITLKLLHRGASLKAFPSTMLGDAIASYNSSARQNIKTEISPQLKQPETRFPSRTFTNTSSNNKENIPQKKAKLNNTEVDKHVDSIITKMQSGLELKDCTASEIFNVYEHKFNSLATRESHLQDLLDAKTQALEQADRLIAQYRNRRAQDDAETHKLRSLLHDYERRNEENREQYNELLLWKENAVNDLEELKQDNVRLDSIAEEHDRLKLQFAEQKQELETAQRTIAASKREYKLLVESHTLLKSHHETLQQQHDVVSKQLAELESHSSELMKTLTEKEAKLSETSKSLKKTESSLKKITKERDEQEEAIDNFRDTLQKTETMKNTLQHQVSSLELVCQQHEKTMVEDKETLKKLREELDKHSQIAALIHNLSSGKAPPNVNL